MTKKFIAGMKKRACVLCTLIWLMITGMAAISWRIGILAEKALAGSPSTSDPMMAASACQTAAYVIAGLAIAVAYLGYMHMVSVPIEPSE